MTVRESMKTLLKTHLRHLGYKNLDARQFDIRCGEIFDAFLKRGSDGEREVARMDAAFTLGRFYREVRRELDREG